MRYYDTQKFFDPFAGGKFAHYLFAAHEKSDQVHTSDSSRYLIDEAHLFVEAAHSCYNRLGTAGGCGLGRGNTSRMELQHVNVKLMLANPDEVDLEPLIPIFHSWIQEQTPGELLLDVADYRHVHAGPGVVLIGYQGDYSVDNGQNRLGVRYNRKAELDGDNESRLTQAAVAALSGLPAPGSRRASRGQASFQREGNGVVRQRSAAGPESRVHTPGRGAGVAGISRQALSGERTIPCRSATIRESYLQRS